MPSPFRANFGGVELLVDSMSGESGRDWSVQSPSRGDEHPIHDQGRKLRRAQCSIRFVDMPGLEDDYLERYLAFERMANDGRPQVFTHPLHGSYLAVVESLSHEVDSEAEEVRCQCVFLAVQEPRAVQPVGAGVSAVAGPEEVGVEASAATEALAAAGVESDVPAAAIARVDAWSTAEDVEARTVLLEAATLTSQIDAEVDRLDLATSYDRWPAYKALIRLRYSVTRAASAATAATARVVDYTIRASTPLRVLCARLYGARAADERAEQIARLNGLRAPGLIRAGTTIKIPSEGFAS